MYPSPESRSNNPVEIKNLLQRTDFDAILLDLDGVCIPMDPVYPSNRINQLVLAQLAGSNYTPGLLPQGKTIHFNTMRGYDGYEGAVVPILAQLRKSGYELQPDQLYYTGNGGGYTINCGTNQVHMNRLPISPTVMQYLLRTEAAQLAQSFVPLERIRVNQVNSVSQPRRWVGKFPGVHLDRGFPTSDEVYKIRFDVSLSQGREFDLITNNLERAIRQANLPLGLFINQTGGIEILPEGKERTTKARGVEAVRHLYLGKNVLAIGDMPDTIDKPFMDAVADLNTKLSVLICNAGNSSFQPRRAGRNSIPIYDFTPNGTNDATVRILNTVNALQLAAYQA